MVKKCWVCRKDLDKEHYKLEWIKGHKEDICKECFKEKTNKESFLIFVKYQEKLIYLNKHMNEDSNFLETSLLELKFNKKLLMILNQIQGQGSFLLKIPYFSNIALVSSGLYRYSDKYNFNEDFKKEMYDLALICVEEALKESKKLEESKDEGIKTIMGFEWFKNTIDDILANAKTTYEALGDKEKVIEVSIEQEKLLKIKRILKIKRKKKV